MNFPFFLEKSFIDPKIQPYVIRNQGFANAICYINRLNGAIVAEWLRRLTRNQIPVGSAGSNPADCDSFFLLLGIVLQSDKGLIFRLIL